MCQVTINAPIMLPNSNSNYLGSAPFTGVDGYKLYRRKAGEEHWKLIYSGEAHRYVDHDVDGVLPANALPGW
jgi:hypothetical protein